MKIVQILLKYGADPNLIPTLVHKFLHLKCVLFHFLFLTVHAAILCITSMSAVAED